MRSYEGGYELTYCVNYYRIISSPLRLFLFYSELLNTNIINKINYFACLPKVASYLGGFVIGPTVRIWNVNLSTTQSQLNKSTT